MNNPEFSPVLRQAELAGMYLSAMAVMARHQRRRVTGIEYDVSRWPGRITFDRPVVSPWERDFAKSGHVTQRRQVERGVMILLAGEVAIDLIDPSAEIESPAPHRAQAATVLRDVDWWFSEADAHLQWLRHRTARHLAQANEWRKVAALTQAMMAFGHLTELQIRQVISKVRKTTPANGNRTVLVRRDSKLGLGLRSSGIRVTPNRRRRSMRMSDGIVTPSIVYEVRSALSHADVRATALSRISQVEPHLLNAIQHEAHARSGKLINMTPVDATAVRGAIVESGLLVAEVMRRAMRDLWYEA